MSDIKEQILFSETMGLDKRDPAFAYLRKNCFRAGTPGLYPAQDFYRENPDGLASGDRILDVIGSEDGTFDIKVIVESGSDVKFYNLGSGSTSNTTQTGVDFECGTFSDDGIKVCLDDDHLYTVNHTNSNVSDEGTFTDARPDIAGFDGLYSWWLSNNEIYKATTGAPVVAFNNIGLTPLFVDFLGDQMVIFCQEAGSIVVLFWDKSDLDLFDKRIVIKNAKLIGGGVNDGVLQIVYGVGNSSNTKEQNGRIVVAGYDGEKFAEMNSIKAGDDTLDYESLTGFGVGSKIMAFSVAGNNDSHNPHLYKNYVYKVHPDGGIEVQHDPDTVTYGDVNVVRVFYNYICLAQRGGTTPEPSLWINEESNDNYGDYEDYLTTEYITEFKGRPSNDHKLDGFLVAFEKMFEQTDEVSDPNTGEELDVYYRVSERDDFTLLMNVTAEKVRDDINPRRDESVEYASDTTGMHEQRYSITKIDEDTPLPEFNEVQYRFVSKRGFSIIGVWHRYSYTSRNDYE
jgi:hypothetical protein